MKGKGGGIGSNRESRAGGLEGWRRRRKRKKKEIRNKQDEGK